jgi:formylglycine-generating enzyme required for sulfatase activity
MEGGRSNFSIIVRDVAIDLVWIEPGTFWMGSPAEEPRRGNNEQRHRVTLTRGFWLGRYPVTQEQFVAVTQEKARRPMCPKCPVEFVTWYDAIAFTEGLTSLVQQYAKSPPGFRFRLPTEAEWEYACRAGTESAFNDGSDCTKSEDLDTALDGLGWYRKNADFQTHPVGAKLPNAWGLYDMHGNLWEWCSDGYRSYSSGSQIDPVGSTDDEGMRMVRGGTFCFADRYCRSASRFREAADHPSLLVGFRLAAGSTSSGSH